MIRGIALLLSLALSACSDKPDAARERSADGTGQVTSAQARAPAQPAGEAGRATADSNLSGKVSVLGGRVSGLNVRASEFGTIVDLPTDALFEFDKAELTPAATVELNKAATLIRESPPGSISVVGHTDSKGDGAYNQRLSEARARSVADWFRQQVGVRQRVYEVSGRGETVPIAPNETTDGKDNVGGRARNRRVELIIPAADRTKAP